MERNGDRVPFYSRTSGYCQGTPVKWYCKFTYLAEGI
jgi:hypothetical protein